MEGRHTRSELEIELYPKSYDIETLQCWVGGGGGKNKKIKKKKTKKNKKILNENII